MGTGRNTGTFFGITLVTIGPLLLCWQAAAQARQQLSADSAQVPLPVLTRNADGTCSHADANARQIASHQFWNSYILHQRFGVEALGRLSFVVDVDKAGQANGFRAVHVEGTTRFELLAQEQFERARHRLQFMPRIHNCSYVPDLGRQFSIEIRMDPPTNRPPPLAPPNRHPDGTCTQPDQPPRIRDETSRAYLALFDMRHFGTDRRLNARVLSDGSVAWARSLDGAPLNDVERQQHVAKLEAAATEIAFVPAIANCEFVDQSVVIDINARPETTTSAE